MGGGGTCIWPIMGVPALGPQADKQVGWLAGATPASHLGTHPHHVGQRQSHLSSLLMNARRGTSYRLICRSTVMDCDWTPPTL